MTTVTVTKQPSQESESLVKEFNLHHQVGEVVAYQKNDNDIQITKIKSKAFISGRWKLPLVKLDIGKGNFSINRIKPVEQVKKNTKKPKQKEISGYDQLKKQIYKDIQEQQHAFVNKMTVLDLFPPIKQYWGVIDDIKQFQIWLRENGWKITSYSTKIYRIEPTKK